MRCVVYLLGAIACLWSTVEPASAYVGPGAGVSLLGALFGLFSMIVLIIWGVARWLFRTVFRLGSKPDVAAAPTEHSPPPITPTSSADTLSAATVKADKGDTWFPGGLQTRLLYLLAGVIVGSAFETPRSIFISWVVAADRVVTGFSDPAVVHHSEIARFDSDGAGVVSHDAARSFHGINMELSAGEPVIRLMDMNGHELHRWTAGIDAIARAWAANGQPQNDLSGLYWRRFHALSDGSVLVVIENRGVTPYAAGMIKLDWDSNIVWMAPDFYHHSIDVGPDERIYTLYQEVVHEPHSHTSWLTAPYLEEGVAILSRDGVELDRIAIIDAFVDTPFESFLRSIQDDAKGDPLHMNTVTYVTEDMARNVTFADAGQLLVSIRDTNTVALIDPVTRKVTWAASDYWVAQHEPVLTDRGTLLIFDNMGPSSERSRAVEWDMSRGQAVWEWAGTADMPLISWKYASIASLPNGSRMVIESYGGRAIEIAQNGDIIWEWRSDRRVGDDGERVARLMDLVRLPAGFFDQLNDTLSLRGSLGGAS